MVSNHLVEGAQAETDALHYLEAQQLKLIERNYKVPFGEIDLIMRDGDDVVFIEVRKRSNVAFGSAAETVDQRKQQRLTKAAQSWMKQKHYEGYCRFDVVALDNNNEIDWIQNAF